VSEVGFKPTRIQPFGRKATAIFRKPVEEDALLNILVGAIRSSKTWAVTAKLLILLWSGWWPGGIGLITGNKKTSIKTNLLNDIFAIVGKKRYKYNSASGELVLLGRPFLVCGANDESSWKAISGSTVGLWIADEITLYPESFFDMAVSRLSLPQSRMYGTCNPAGPYHYLKKKWLENKELIANGDIWSDHFTLEDNPNIVESRKDGYRRMYTGVFYQRNILGLWVIAEGAIYRDCLTEENYYTDETRPLGLTGQGGYVERTVSVDYGTGNAMVFGDIYDDGQVCWLEREYYWDSREQRRQKTDREYADDLVEFLGTDLRKWPVIIVDPSAASFKAELRSRNIVVLDGKNDVENGIRRVSTMLSRNMLRIHKVNCPNTVREMGTYAWNIKRADNGKEQPLKVNDHSADMVRYFVETKIGDWRLAA
jgi:PBSX family phage terminase large subunit